MNNCIHIINYFRQGGAENVAYNYIKVLADLGVSSTIIGKPFAETYENRFKEVATVEYALSNDIIKKANYIFIHSNQGLLRLYKYYSTIKKHNIRVIYIQHLRYAENKFRILSKLINTICTDFIQITPITTDLIQKYINIKTHFIVNFYLNRYSESDWNCIRNEIRNKYDIPNDCILVTFSAIFKPGKNLGKFIEIATELQNNYNYKFLLIGDGPEAYLINEYNGNNLIWVGKVNDVEKYLLASDIYLFLSKIEMMPMALIEAINTNKQIIAYDTEINNFLLRNQTFHNINKYVLQESNIPNGADLIHYDSKYANTILAKLLG